MGVSDGVVEGVIQYLRQKQWLSVLESDIISTVNVYVAKSFDRSGAERKIVENNMAYPDMFVSIKNMSGIQVKPFSQVTDAEILNNLKMQIEEMCVHEQRILMK